jgi:branched-chain amino acid aminotransferase
MALVNFNGRVLPAEDCLLPLSNRSFRYGDGFFESIRIHKGISPLFDLHEKRISNSLATLKMDYSPDLQLHQKLKDIVHLNKHENGRGRITFFRDSTGFYGPDQNKTAFLVESAEMDEPFFNLNEKGYQLNFYRAQAKINGALSGIKSTSSLLYVMAAEFVSANDLDDCILLNEKGNIVESGRANVFVVKSGMIYTPPVSEGCIPGVMRQHIINTVASTGSRVIEEPIHPDFLAGCSEMFTSSAVQGIRWAESCGPFCFTKGLSLVLQRKITENLI